MDISQIVEFLTNVHSLDAGQKEIAAGHLVKRISKLQDPRDKALSILEVLLLDPPIISGRAKVDLWHQYSTVVEDSCRYKDNQIAMIIRKAAKTELITVMAENYVEVVLGSGKLIPPVVLDAFVETEWEENLIITSQLYIIGLTWLLVRGVTRDNVLAICARGPCFSTLQKSIKIIEPKEEEDEEPVVRRK